MNVIVTYDRQTVSLGASGCDVEFSKKLIHCRSIKFALRFPPASPVTVRKMDSAPLRPPLTVLVKPFRVLPSTSHSIPRCVFDQSADFRDFYLAFF